MKMELRRLNLPLQHPFTISRASITHQASLAVELHHNGHVGLGEVTANPYYGHTLDSISEALSGAAGVIDRYANESPIEVWHDAKDALNGNSFALAALDLAAHDLFGKLNKQPCYAAWGLKWEKIPVSSYTIGIDTVETMVGKLNERPGWSIYKIKLGTENDLQIVKELRKHTDAIFRIDANCGWTVDETIENSKTLKQLNVEFIEQPLTADASDADKERVFSESTLPIVADENCQTEDDVTACHGFFHGINVKLCKCGGLTPALRMLQQARELGMKTMVGCMIESSIGISAAAQLLPLLDYADLDGAILLSDDPATGIQIDQGKVALADRYGTGAAWA